MGNGAGHFLERQEIEFDIHIWPFVSPPLHLLFLCNLCKYEGACEKIKKNRNINLKEPIKRGLQVLPLRTHFLNSMIFTYH